MNSQTSGKSGKVIGLIPARLESSRLPGKALKIIQQYEMIIHVVKRSALCKDLDGVAVCTDSREIANTCSNHGIPVALTASYHINGTERIGEAAAMLKLEPNDIIVDIQGDEALVDPEVISRVIAHLKSSGADIVVPYLEIADGINENRVKIIESNGRILYMTRARAPYPFLKESFYKKHLSVIAFRYSALEKFCASPASPLEKIEGVELLRGLECGLNLHTYKETSESLAVDTHDDYKQVCRLMPRDPYYGKY